MEKAVRYGNRKLQNWRADRKLKPLAGGITGRAGGGQGQCGCAVSKGFAGESPACGQQSHLPDVAEKEAAKAVCRRIPGGA